MERVGDVKIDHIGYLVKDMDSSRKRFESLGFETDFPEYEDDFFDQSVLFLSGGGYRVELICPRSERAVAFPLLEKRGVGPYHLCFSTSNFNEDFLALRKLRFVPTVAPVLAETGPLKGRRLTFLINKDFGLLELVEDEACNAS